MRAFVLSLLFGLFATSAFAEDVAVNMWSKNPETNEMNSFSPGVVMVNAGDTVVWMAQQPGHNVEFLDGAVPAGVAAFRSGFDKEIRYTFDKPGVYAYKCMPHYGLGMIGLVVVGGDVSNLDTVKAFKFPGMAGKRAQALFTQLDEMLAK